MKRLIGALLTIMMLIAISGVAIQQFDDRELFTSPPEAAGEDFMRAVVNGRYDQATAYCLHPESVSEESLRSLHKSIEARFGDVHDVKGETVTHTRDEALVNVQLKSAQGSDALAFRLVFESGEWKITR